MTLGEALFPTLADLAGKRDVDGLAALAPGPVADWDDLLRRHVDLLSEDFLGALGAQVRELRADPAKLDSLACYAVQAAGSVCQVPQGQSTVEALELFFDAELYREVDWEAERRLLHGNLVLLTQTQLRDWTAGVVASRETLREGSVVVRLLSGVSPRGKLQPLDQSAFLRRHFHLVESRPFYFPYLHVTNALRLDASRGARSLAPFRAELVDAHFPSQPPDYAAEIGWQSGRMDALLQRFRGELNASQMAALESVLRQRLALVQGPPGTGKTFLGCKLAEYFVNLKRSYRTVFPGPVFVVTTTNHAVHEFLTRCTGFTDKIIHGYSEQHERVSYGPLQDEYDAAATPQQRRRLMAQAEVLAMTTTRAAFLRRTLDKLGVAIVIVEEACEALEGYVLAAIPMDTQHIVQIGDHRQLRPHCAHQPLAQSHMLDVSLFERLAEGGAAVAVLSEQRRMRPEAADLVRPLYPRLTDHPCTRGRPRVRGVDLDVPVFLVSLPHATEQAPLGGSYSNFAEAAFAAHLAQYLVLQGYSPADVTILVTYRKQLQLVQRKVEQMEGNVRDVRVATVDAFQGEESPIVILSLVRSNPEGNLGFLSWPNRVCVALSRARDGLFILGDMRCLQAAPVWRSVRTALAGRLGPALPLACPHGCKFLASSAAAIRQASAGCALCHLQQAVPLAEAAEARATAELSEAREDLAAAERELEGAAAVRWPFAEDRLGALARRELLRSLCVRRQQAAAECGAAAAAARRRLERALLLAQRGRLDPAVHSPLAVERRLQDEEQHHLIPGMPPPARRGRRRKRKGKRTDGNHNELLASKVPDGAS